MLRFAFLLAVVCSILSQMPTLLQTSLGDALKVTWILPLVISLFTCGRRFADSPVRVCLVFVVAFTLFCLFAETFTGNQYFYSADYKNILISLGIFITSYASWFRIKSQSFLNTLIIASVIATLATGYVIYRDFLSTTSITQLQYAYASKNSAAQILLNTVIFCLAFKAKNKSLYLMLGCATLIMIGEIFVLKSRATILSLAFVLIYLGIKSKNKKLRKAIWMGVIVVGIYLVANAAALGTLVDNILLANRDASNVDDVSSGRVVLIGWALAKFEQSPFLGAGNFYIDCFPVSIIGQFGIIGAIIVFTFIGYIFRKNLRTLRSDKFFYQVSFLMYGSILINALFEAQPPFGPGMKCFMVWMVLGFAFADYRKHIQFKIKTPAVSQQIPS